MDKQIFIGGAWPYANNSMHIGHLAALLPGDVIAKYFRQNGDKVIYVSGSDCHGTPITLRANKLGIDPKVIADHYHNEFTKNFNDLNFTYDMYTNTMTPYHEQAIIGFIKKISKNGLLYTKEEEDYFCPTCNKFVADRELVGQCPICGAEATGDQCDKCLTALTPDMVLNKKCKVCGSSLEKRKNTHIYFAMSKLTDVIREYVEKNGEGWRQTAVNESLKYLNEGLRDRAITRDINWGIEIPFEGFENKRLYVWIDAVLGYMTTGRLVAEKKGIDFDKFIRDPETISYYSHGKDNIVFHTIILPSLLEAIDPTINKPNKIVSCEYVNMNNEKMSKSKGNLISVNTLTENFNPDSIRFFFTINNPEKKDSSFSLDDFINTHNKQLVGGYGNFVNRNLSFLVKKFGGVLPELELDKEVKIVTESFYNKIGKCLENGDVREASLTFYEYVQYANRYYDQNAPWILAKENLSEFNKVTSNCIYLIANLANISSPILTEASEYVTTLLGVKKGTWEPVTYDSNIKLANLKVLYNRIDEKDVDMEKGSEDTLQKKTVNKIMR